MGLSRPIGLVGGGPSLSGFDLERLRGRFRVSVSFREPRVEVCDDTDVEQKHCTAIGADGLKPRLRDRGLAQMVAEVGIIAGKSRKAAA